MQTNASSVSASNRTNMSHVHATPGTGTGSGPTSRGNSANLMSLLRGRR